MQSSVVVTRPQCSARCTQLRLPARATSLASTSFTPDAAGLLRPGPVRSTTARQLTVQPVAFKFMKQLGLKKPDFLPDFGQAKRKDLLDRFYYNFDEATYDDVLADNFTMQERRAGAKAYSKHDWKTLTLNAVKPSIPDFKWTHATDASKNKEGFCVVKIQATGHFTGKPLDLPGLPTLEPNGKKFLLAEETQLVLVEDGKIVKIEVLPVAGAGPRAMYEALGGKVPVGA